MKLLLTLVCNAEVQRDARSASLALSLYQGNLYRETTHTSALRDLAHRALCIRTTNGVSLAEPRSVFGQFRLWRGDRRRCGSDCRRPGLQFAIAKTQDWINGVAHADLPLPSGWNLQGVRNLHI